MTRRACVAIVLTLVGLWSGPGAAQGQNTPRLFVQPADGFEVFISAAMANKNVAVDVVTDVTKADYVMRATTIEVEKVSTGAKWANCIFASCAGNGDKGSTSVQVVDKEGVVQWSYAVNKGRGAKNKQSMAEAIAKHFKDDFLRRK